MSVNALGQSALAPHSFTRTGSFSGPHGGGSFTSTTSDVNGARTINDTITFANGKTETRNTTVTKNADGSLSYASAITLPNGKTEQRDVTVTRAADGSGTATGSLTLPDGTVDQVAGSFGTTGRSWTITNPAGATERLNVNSARSGNTVTTTYAGTDFSGGSIASTVIETLNANSAASAPLAITA